MPGICLRLFQYRPFRVTLALALIVVSARFWCFRDSVSAARADDGPDKSGRVAAAEHSPKENPRKTADPAKLDPADVDFFEKKVRPILSARCQGCHGPEKQKGGLRLDARATVLSGGSTGPAVVPGNPKESLLVDAINYGETYQMPPKSKLPPEEIATLTEWVQRGAPWGITARTSAESAASSRIPGAISKAEFQARAQYWSFQPLQKVSPPAVTRAHAGWLRNPIDRFILAALEQKNLAPAPEAGKRTLIRRLSFDLTGLPPKREDVEAFLNDRAPDAYEKLVDSLLASPHYGERWARHWLDLVRYAETAGHEFDYEIPNAFRYRDYVIRAFNLDLPYNQLIFEHISGDALPKPRRHPVEGFNESAIGAGFHTLGEGVHSPVDIREEQMRRVDNQLDVLSKTFLGLTLACARCHDHKFDPITAQDYYAMAGYLVSSRHQQAFIDPPDRIGHFVKSLRAINEKIVATLREARAKLPEPAPKQPAAAPPDAHERVLANFDQPDFDGWYVTGDAFGERPSRAGDFRLDRNGTAARLVSIAPGLAHSGMVSDRLQGVLRSRSFTIESRYLHFLTGGQGGRISVVIDGFEKIRSPIYGGLTTSVNTGGELRWITMDVQMWAGHSAYFEIADGAVVDFGGATSQVDDGHGWIAVALIRSSDQPTPSAKAGPHPRSIAHGDLDLTAAIAALRPARPELAARLAEAVTLADSLDRRIPDPTLAPSQAEGTGMDEHVHIRGSHKNLGEKAPRHFLTVLGGSDWPAHAAGSGRIELAGRMVNPTVDPLVPRVLVNRLWQHHFGEGIVRSTDDFGAMGQKPSHPELLDWLAARLVENGWSIKAMHRLMLLSSAFRMSSVPEAAAEQVDPANTLLHRMNVRRLEAEAIRDTLLAVTGRLEGVMYGPSVPVHLTSYMEGRGRPGVSGALDGDGRRSIYLSVRRNFLNPMLLAFDAPVPFSTMGRRNVSNVPAQALTLLNDPLVKSQSRLWAERQVARPGRSVRQRLDALFLTALGRAPTDQEARASLEFLTTGRSKAQTSPAGPDPEPKVEAWADFCHVLINMKEFIFVD
jgi:mono/diheme cytochrome c family protein